MGSSFIRRFSSYPGDAEISSIEGPVIIDGTPPASLVGVGTGRVAVVGEFLKGPINTPTRISSGQEMKDIFGSWSPYSNPGGDRPAPGNPPTWQPGAYDGNGFLAVAGKKFADLILVRVNDVVGTCTITMTAGPDPDNALNSLPRFTGVIPAGVRAQDAAGANVLALAEDTAVAEGTDALHPGWTGTGTVGDPWVFTATEIDVRRVLGAAAGPLPDNVPLPERTGLYSGYTLDVTAFSAIVDIAEAAMGANYVTALDTLLAEEDLPSGVSVVCSARHPAGADGVTLMNQLKQHARTASDKGRGRTVCVAPRIGTAIATAQGAAGLGVGNVAIGRNDRVDYCHPGVQRYIKELPLAAVTEATDGVIVWPSDSTLLSVLSQLQPEYNPGAYMGFMDDVLGLEYNLGIMSLAVYKAYKAAGICAPKMGAKGPVFQSGVTSVSPTTDPSLVNIFRRRMADYIQDTLAERYVGFEKLPSTIARRNAVLSETTEFLDSLKSPDQPALQRIDDYSVTDQENTEARPGIGIYIVTTEVRLLGSLNNIVLNSLIGETVTISAA